MNLEQERPFVCSAPGCSQVSGVSGDINWVLSTSSGLYNASWYINTCLIIMCVLGFFSSLPPFSPSVPSFTPQDITKYLKQIQQIDSQKWVGGSASPAASVPSLIPRPNASRQVLQILLVASKRAREDTLDRAHLFVFCLDVWWNTLCFLLDVVMLLLFLFVFV